MKKINTSVSILSFFGFIAIIGLCTCNRLVKMEESIILELKEQGLTAEVISAEQFFKGIVPHNFEAAAGASYKPFTTKIPKSLHSAGLKPDMEHKMPVNTAIPITFRPLGMETLSPLLKTRFFTAFQVQTLTVFFGKTLSTRRILSPG